MNTEKIVKIIILIGIAVLLYVPFVVTSSMFFPFITGKAYVFRITIEIIFALWLILAILYKEYRPKKSWILYSFGLLLISLFISNWFGENRVASFWSNYERMEGYVMIVHAFMLFIALGSILREKIDWIWLFNGSMIAGFAMSVMSLISVVENGFNFRVETSLGNSTYLGIYMLMNSFLALYLLFRSKIGVRSWRTWIYGFLFVIQSIIVFQTGTRGSMIGYLAGIGVLVGTMLYYNRGDKKVKIFSIVTVSVIILFVSSISVFKNTDFVQSSVSLNRLSSISLTEDLAQARFLNWKMALEGFKEKPILGWGQSNFNLVFDKYYLPEHYGNEVWFDRVHNIILDWLVTSGIIGLFLYLSIWVTTLYALFKSNNFDYKEKAVLYAFGVSYFIHNMFVFDQVVSYMYFVFILAFIYSQTSEDLKFFQKDLKLKSTQLTTALVLVLLPITIYAVNIPSLKSNTDLIKGLRILTTNENKEVVLKHPNGLADNIKYLSQAEKRNTFGNSEIRQRILFSVDSLLNIKGLDPIIVNEYIQFAATEGQKQINEFPNDSKYLYVYGLFLARMGQIELAEQSFLSAIDISPNKQYMRSPLIRLYALTNQLDKALALAEETYLLDTSKTVIEEEYLSIKEKVGE